MAVFWYGDDQLFLDV